MTARQVISDKTAKRLWLILGLITVSAIPALELTTVPWGQWGPELASRVGTTVVAWAGAIASLLGLSRYAPASEPTDGN